MALDRPIAELRRFNRSCPQRPVRSKKGCWTPLSLTEMRMLCEIALAEPRIASFGHDLMGETWEMAR